MGRAQAIPSSRRTTLGGPWHRLASRWQNGGVEEYLLGELNGRRPLSRFRLRSRFELTYHQIRLERLPNSFRDFRIVQLTDIHHGLYLPAEALAAAVEMVNELAPDLVALTGDFVTLSRGYIEPAAEALGELKARYGVYAVLGNHDFRVGADQIARALIRAGVRVLRNGHTEVRRHGDALYLAGVDDLRYHADLPRALRGIPSRAPILLLSHNPAIIRPAARFGVELVLSGHTHGGQVRLPVLGCIYGRSQQQLRFKVGWARLGPTQIYVSRGIGTVVLPLRFRCPAEIPHFSLVPARAHLDGAYRSVAGECLTTTRPNARR